MCCIAAAGVPLIVLAATIWHPHLRPPDLATAPNTSALASVHVAYAADTRAYAGLLGSMLSLGRHVRSPGNCSLHVLAFWEDLWSAKQLTDCFVREFPSGPAVILHHFHPLNYDVSNYTFGFPPQCFARLYLHEHLPTAPRVIWLDTDTVVQSDIARLYRMPMRHALAAWLHQVPGPLFPFERLVHPMDAYLPCLTRAPDNRVLHNLLSKLPAEASFNAGVLLVDLSRWRGERIAAEVEKWLSVSEGPPKCFPEQLAMNLALRGKVDALPWSWNCAGLGDEDQYNMWHCGAGFRCAADVAHILHWSGFRKPWFPSEHRNRRFDYLFNQSKPRERCMILQEEWR